MIHTEHYRLKWHDTDANRRLSPSQLLMYMQETANHHILTTGTGLDALRDEQGLAFLLSRIAIRIYEPLHAYESIDVQTWICEGRGLSFPRCFRVLREGVTVAEAFSIWALMDLQEHRLLAANAFPYRIEPEEPLGRELSARVRYPSLAGMEKAGERRIVYSDLDYNGHMNNTHYPNMLCDFIPEIERRRVVGMNLSFLHEAAYGHTLDVYRAEEGDTQYFRTVDEDGTVCLEAAVMTELTDEQFH